MTDGYLRSHELLAQDGRLILWLRNGDLTDQERLQIEQEQAFLRMELFDVHLMNEAGSQIPLGSWSEPAKTAGAMATALGGIAAVLGGIFVSRFARR